MTGIFQYFFPIWRGKKPKRQERRQTGVNGFFFSKITELEDQQGWGKKEKKS